MRVSITPAWGEDAPRVPWLNFFGNNGHMDTAILSLRKETPYECEDVPVQCQEIQASYPLVDDAAGSRSDGTLMANPQPTQCDSGLCTDGIDVPLAEEVVHEDHIVHGSESISPDDETDVEVRPVPETAVGTRPTFEGHCTNVEAVEPSGINDNSLQFINIKAV